MRRGSPSDYDDGTCGRKVKYRSAKAAKDAVRLMQRWGKGHCEQLGVYLCGVCRQWHAGRAMERRR